MKWVTKCKRVASLKVYPFTLVNKYTYKGDHFDLEVLVSYITHGMKRKEKNVL